MVQRWDFREQEKRELEAEQKRKAGVSSTSKNLKLMLNTCTFVHLNPTHT